MVTPLVVLSTAGMTGTLGVRVSPIYLDTDPRAVARIQLKTVTRMWLINGTKEGNSVVQGGQFPA